MPRGVGQNSRLNNIVSVVEPSGIPLPITEFCPPSHGDPFPALEDKSLLNVGL